MGLSQLPFSFCFSIFVLLILDCFAEQLFLKRLRKSVEKATKLRKSIKMLFDTVEKHSTKSPKNTVQRIG